MMHTRYYPMGFTLQEKVQAVQTPFPPIQARYVTAPPSIEPEPEPEPDDLAPAVPTWVVVGGVALLAAGAIYMLTRKR